jgi:GntR family transcriptional repressor for pyruvate dehydrogenase complex
MAAERRNDWEIKQMEEMISVREKAVKAQKTPVVSNIDFHQAIARATKNPLSILIMDTIGDILFEEFKRFDFSLNDHKSIIKLHREIFECIRNKDAQRVGNIMFIHLKDVKKRLKI